MTFDKRWFHYLEDKYYTPPDDHDDHELEDDHDIDLKYELARDEETFS